MLARLLLFTSLGLDTFAVAVSLGVAGLPRDRWRRIGLTFAAFEGLMPALGLLIGARLSGMLGIIAGYGAALLLIAVGTSEIREAIGSEDEERDDDERALLGGFRPLVIAGLSVSMDELAVGFSMGLLRVPIGPALAYIAAQAFGVTFLGLAVGRRVGETLGERAELAAGLGLAGLGVILLVRQAMGG